MTQLLTQEQLDDIKADYAASLLDLTFNSKPIINMLTSIAQENLDGAGAIAKAVEEHIAKAPPAHKLPAMYLLDSITKNVGAPYTPLFARNLYKTFMSVYTAVEPPIRKKLEDLFYTWTRPLVMSNTQDPVYPPEATRKIEETLMRVRELQRREETVHPPGFQAGMTPSFAQQQAAASLNPVADLVRDVQALLQSFAQRLLVDPDNAATRNHVTSLSALQQVLQTTVLPPGQLAEIMQQIGRLKQQTLGPQMSRMTPPAGYGPPPSGQTRPPPGFVPGSTLRIPLTTSSMLPSRPELIHLLYAANPLQCGLCGQRWPNTPEGQGKRDAHLDWHFKVNKRLRDHAVRGQSRAVYLTEQDWISLRISGEGDVQDVQGAGDMRPSTTGTAAMAALSLEEADKRTVPRPSDAALHDSECPICCEKFVTDWDDVTEDWVWKNAVQVGTTIYHATCHHDAVASNAKAAAAGLQRGDAPEIAVESDEEDVPLPGAPVVRAIKSASPEAQPVKGETAMPMMLDAAALASLAGSISAMTAAAAAQGGAIKRKAEDEEDESERRVKQELDL